MNITFTGSVVVVAGGTGGLGRAVSVAFLREGAKVIVTYRKEAEFLALIDALGVKSSALEGHRIDLTDENAVDDFFQGVFAKHGSFDALVNCVGGYVGGVKLWDSTQEILEQMLSLNLRAGYVLARAVVPAMLKAGRGSIVNVAAKAALDHGGGAGAYAASKAASVALMDSLAADTRGTGVRVNSILPSIIDTAANRLAMPDSDFETWPKPEDIAKVVLFLCSECAKAIHGAAVPVYGGA